MRRIRAADSMSLSGNSPSQQINKIDMLELRVHLLLILTALLVAYVRNFLQYGDYIFSSFSIFVGFWIIHYFAVGFLAVLFSQLLNKSLNVILPSEPSGIGRSHISTNVGVASFCIALILCSVVIFLLAHWPHREPAY